MGSRTCNAASTSSIRKKDIKPTRSIIGLQIGDENDEIDMRRKTTVATETTPGRTRVTHRGPDVLIVLWTPMLIALNFLSDLRSNSLWVLENENFLIFCLENGERSAERGEGSVHNRLTCSLDFLTVNFFFLFWALGYKLLRVSLNIWRLGKFYKN